MPKKLTQEQIAAYERDGYVCPVDAFATEQARSWRDRLEAFERAEGRKMTRGHNFKPHLLFPWVDEIVHALHPHAAEHRGRIEVGEGIEVVKEDFAAEVAKMKN